MRYALRNKEKIKQALGVWLVIVLEQSLKAHFKEHEVIKGNYSSKGREVLQIFKLGTEEILEFYIIGQRFDVIHLAYKPKEKSHEPKS